MRIVISSPNSIVINSINISCVRAARVENVLRGNGYARLCKPGKLPIFFAKKVGRGAVKVSAEVFLVAVALAMKGVDPAICRKSEIVQFIWGAREELGVELGSADVSLDALLGAILASASRRGKEKR